MLTPRHYLHSRHVPLYGIRWYTMWITWLSLNILHADYKEIYFPNFDVHKIYHMTCFSIYVMSETSNDCVTHS